MYKFLVLDEKDKGIEFNSQKKNLNIFKLEETIRFVSCSTRPGD